MSAKHLFPPLKRWGNRTCNIVENGVATLWKNYLQLSGKSSCKKHSKYQRFRNGIATCGGPIDLLVITKDYTKFVKHKILNP
jgi:hypothetical protein